MATGDPKVASGDGLDTGSNSEFSLLTLTTASVGVNSADMGNRSASGIKLFINITAITGTTPTLTVTLQGKDSTSGTYFTMLASTALNATGFTVLTVFPGAAATANVSANDHLPLNWRVITAIGGTGPSVTATITASLLV